MEVRLQVTIQDTLGFYDDYLGDYAFNPQNTATNTYWLKVPADWLANGAVLAAKWELFLQYLYGTTWRLGNEDGSKYIIISQKAEIWTSEAQPWLEKKRCYGVDVNGRIEPLAVGAF